MLAEDGFDALSKVNDHDPDLIFCDPPFFNVKLDRLYRAIMVLARQDPTIPVVLMYLFRREGALLSTFSQFDLHPMDFWPGYVSVGEATGIRMYASSSFLDKGQPIG